MYRRRITTCFALLLAAKSTNFASASGCTVSISARIGTRAKSAMAVQHSTQSCGTRCVVIRMRRSASRQ